MEKVQFKKPSKWIYLIRVIWLTVTLSGLIYVLKLYAYYLLNCLYGHKKAKIGKNTNVHCTVIIREPQNVVIGNNCYFNHNTIMHGGKKDAKLIIGNYVQTGPNVAFFVSNHDFSNRQIPIMQQGYYEGDVTIEDDVWIGANSVIVPGVRVGKGSVVGAGSVVTKDIPPYSICAGTPAKVIKKRNEQ